METHRDEWVQKLGIQTKEDLLEYARQYKASKPELGDSPLSVVIGLLDIQNELAAANAEIERLQGELKRIAQTAQDATEKAKLETHPGATYRDGLSIMMHLALMALPIDQQP